MRRSLILFAPLSIGLLALTAPVHSDERPESRYGPKYDLSISPVYQSEVDIDGGGSFSHSSGFFRFGASVPVSRYTSAGVSLKYDVDDYEFNGLTEFGGAEPWNDVSRTGIGLPLFTRFENSWSLGVTPSVNWLMENGADSGGICVLGCNRIRLPQF